MKWHSGPPPFVGWWLCRGIGGRCWRWWDGRDWSSPAYPTDGADYAALAAKHKAMTEDVQWTHYWPAGARVPRVEPGA